MDAIIESFAQLGTLDGIMALLTLSVLEIVLGIDNLVFISILVGKAKPKDQKKIRMTGLALAMIFRIILLMCVSWLIGLDQHLFSIGELSFSWKDLILLAGGFFLLTKSVMEIHHKMNPKEQQEEREQSAAGKAFTMMIFQIVLVDLVFSIDSILTAVGLTREIGIMIVAVVISMAFMMIFARAVGEFINRNPTIVMLALAFLIMIAVLLIMEGLGQGEKIDRGYIYFAMAFAFIVEMLNLRIRKNRQKKKEAEGSSEA